jgi:hypothetical protein
MGKQPEKGKTPTIADLLKPPTSGGHRLRVNWDTIRNGLATISSGLYLSSASLIVLLR